MSRYDANEAIQLLNDCLGDRPEAADLRRVAALELLDALVALNRDRSGLLMARDPEGLRDRVHCRVNAGGRNERRLVVLADPQGRIRIAKPSGVAMASPGDEISLSFDPVQRTLSGREADTYHTAKPGEPRRRRSALAVVVARISQELMLHLG